MKGFVVQGEPFVYGPDADSPHGKLLAEVYRVIKAAPLNDAQRAAVVVSAAIVTLHASRLGYDGQTMTREEWLGIAAALYDATPVKVAMVEPGGNQA